MRSPVLALIALPLLCAADEIPAGTRVVLRAEQAVGSRTSKPGDRLHLRAAAPAIYENRIVIPVDSFIEAEVAAVSRTRWVGGKPTLVLRATRIVLPDGRIRPIDSLNFEAYPARSRRHPPNRPYLAATGVVVGLIGIPVVAYGSAGDRAFMGALGGIVITGALLGRGTEIEIREGMTLEAVFETSQTLD